VSRRRPEDEAEGRRLRPVDGADGDHGDEADEVDDSRVDAIWVPTGFEETPLGRRMVGKLVNDPEAVRLYLETGLIPGSNEVSPEARPASLHLLGRSETDGSPGAS
jgi:hypothetical protein